MARTKKEIEEQAPDAEQETTGTESDCDPQTDKATPPGDVHRTSSTDRAWASPKNPHPAAPHYKLDPVPHADRSHRTPPIPPYPDPQHPSDHSQTRCRAP